MPAGQAAAAPQTSGIRPMRNAAGGMSTVAKVVVGVGLAGCLAFIFARMTASNAPAARAVPASPATSVRASEAPFAPQPPETDRVEHEPPTLSVEDLPTATRPSAAGAPIREEQKGAHPVAPASPAVDQTSLEAELAQLRGARDAIRRGVPQDALHQLAAYALQFPNGLLKPEAEALTIEAEVAAGRTAQARAHADAFLAAHPDTPQAPRIRRIREQLDP
jgi:hypothetical protein